LDKSQIELIHNKVYYIIYVSHCILLAISSVFLFLLLSMRLKPINAFWASLLYGTNPYLIILTGLLHYDILHLTLIIISCYFIAMAVKNNRMMGIKLAVAGILWGITTLIRPTSLILPVFIVPVIIYIYRSSFYFGMKAAGIFIIGFIIAITPYTYRNYSVSKKIIPISAQSGFGLWNGTAIKLPRSPNHYRYWELMYGGDWGVGEGMRIYHQVVPKDLNIKNLEDNILILDKKFKEQALINIRKQPSVYLYNIINNFLTFNLDINSVLIKLFQYVQHSNNEIQKDFFTVGNQQNFYPDSSSTAFKFYIYALTLLSFMGIIIGIIRTDSFIMLLAAVYFCFAFAHSITYMDLMYYYNKMPFLFIFSGYLIDKTSKCTLKIMPADNYLTVDHILNGIFILYNLGLMASVILFN